jgi:hypothetical protein
VNAETESEGGVWTVTEAGVAGGWTGRGAPEFASVATGAPVTDIVPAADGVHVQVNCCDFWEPMVTGSACATGVHDAVADPDADGVIEAIRAPALPPLVRVKVNVTPWPTVALFRPAEIVAVSAGGSCDVTVAPGALAPTDAPVFASAPATVAASVSDPAMAGVQVQVNASWPEPGTVCGSTGAGAPQAAPSTGVTAGVTAERFALPPPVLVTVSVTASGWPIVTVVGLPVTARVVLSAAGAWTATSAGRVGVAESGAPEFASLPVAVALSETVLGVVPVQDQVNALDPPEGIVRGSGPGAPQVALPAGSIEVFTAVMLALAVPPFVTLRVTVNPWPVPTLDRLAPIVAATPAGSWTVTGGAEAGALCTVSPEKPSTADAVTASWRCPAALAVNVKVNVADPPAGRVAADGGLGPAERVAPPPSLDVAVAVGTTCVTALVPVFVMVAVSVRACPTLASVALAVALAASAPEGDPSTTNAPGS